MAVRKFLTHIDLNNNQLLKAVLENVSSLPSPNQYPVGRIVYNLADNMPYYIRLNDNSQKVWATFGVDYNFTGKEGIATTENTLSDGTVLVEIAADLDPSGGLDYSGSGDSRQIKIAVSGVKTANIADHNVTYIKLQQVAARSVIGNVSSSAGTASDVAIISQITASSTDNELASAAAIVSYVDGKITGVGTFVGNWDVSSTTAFPATGKNGDIVAGDYWIITKSDDNYVELGSSNKLKVRKGDVIYAKVDTPGQDGSNWFAVEKNQDIATIDKAGLIELATQAEVNAGTPGALAVTPETLHEYLNGMDPDSVIRGSSHLLNGDDTTTSWTITLDNNAEMITTQVFDENNVQVECEISVTPGGSSAATVTISVNEPIGTGHTLRAVIHYHTQNS